jgi:ParB-like chromosome segregation protein Spo0J
MNITKFDLDDLREYPNNARRGDVSVLVESLKINGQYRPIVVQKSTKHVLAGNHLLRAAKILGWDQVDAVVIDVDDQQALKIVLADNRTADLGDYNTDLLATLLRDLEDFEGTGYSLADIEELEAVINKEPQEERSEVEFSLGLRETNNYVILMFDNELDWQAAIDTFQLKTVKAWDSRKGFSRMGIGRVVKGADVVQRLNNADS